MPSVQYQDTSMYGTYWVDCQVLRKIDEDTFEIKFFDDEIKEDEIKIVKRDSLQFPRFTDYMFC